MDLFKRTITSMSTFYREMNPATLSGAIDVIVVRQENGDLVCSPFHVRFGKLKLLRPADNRVIIRVNGQVVDLSMKVGEAGEGFFVVETNRPVPVEMATSPIQGPMSPPAAAEAMSQLDLNQLAPTSLSASSSESALLDRRDVAVEELPRYSSAVEELPTATEDGALAQLPRQGEDSFASSAGERASASPSAELLATSPPGGSAAWSWKWGGLPVKKAQGEAADVQSASTEQVLVTDQKERGSPVSMDTGGDPDLPMLPLTAENALNWTHEYRIELSMCYEQLSGLSDAQAAEALFQQRAVRFEDFCNNPTALSHPNLAVRIDGHIFRWSVAAPLLASLTVFKKPITRDAFKLLLDGMRETSAADKRVVHVGAAGPPPQQGGRWFSFFGRRDNSKRDLELGQESHSTGDLAPMSPRRAATADDDRAAASSPNLTRPPPTPAPAVHYAKTLRLTSEQLKALPLKEGANSVEFIVSGNANGEAACRASIYLWKHDVKLVISDIDGTITKSDVMGHLFTAVGKDWTHSGVANLYSNIAKNGYKILYVTSRAIGQSNYTKEFLKWVEQSGGWRLPDGPCICAPDRLLAAFTREVIQKRPQEFKIAVLTDISKLFPSRTPFYAGFGNRATDAEAYRAVEVPIQRIFTINPKSDIKLELVQTYKSTYVGLNDIVDQMFPPVTGKSRDLDESFNDFNYWRSPLPEVQLDIIDDEVDARKPGDTFEGGDDGDDDDDDKEQTGGYPFYGLA